jgi:hypothetical protein
MQLIKYRWSAVSGSGVQPFFVTATGDSIRLLGQEIGFRVGEKYCTGYFSKGEHHQCPTGAAVASGTNCHACRLNDDFFMCVKCTGDECINRKQRPSCEESLYFVYLAAFGKLIKVGISHERRLIERLIEQGADFGAKVARVKDGFEVRRVEQNIRRHLGIVDFVRGEVKQKMLLTNPNDCVTSIFSAIAEMRTNGFAEHMVPPEVYDLRDYYHLNKISYNPEPVAIKTGIGISGTVVAAKGPVLVINSSRHLYSINSHDMIGRDVTSAVEGVATQEEATKLPPVKAGGIK